MLQESEGGKGFSTADLKGIHFKRWCLAILSTSLNCHERTVDSRTALIDFAFQPKIQNKGNLSYISGVYTKSPLKNLTHVKEKINQAISNASQN